MHATFRSLAAPALIALGGLAFAQAPFDLEARTPWHTGLGAPIVLNRTVAGDVSGDGHLDLFVRGGTDGNRIVYFDSVWSNAGSMNTGIPCNDFDIAPGQGVDGAAALAFVDSYGLGFLKFNRATGTFLSLATPIAGDWAGAQMVRTGDFDNSGVLDYVGVKPDGHTLILRANGGPTNVLVTGIPTILDVAFVQWVNTPAHEIAVLTSAGVQIFLGDGSAFGGVSIPGFTGKAMAVLPVPNAVDRLAWIGTNNTTGKTWFGLLRRASADIENHLQLDANDTTADSLATGDMNGDGLTDVIVGRSSSLAPWYMPNLGSVPWFNPTNAKQPFAWASVYTAAGAPVVARFVNGEVPHLVLPTFSTSGGELVRFAHSTRDLTSSDVFRFENPVYLLDAPNTPAGLPQREVRFQLNFHDEVLTAGATEDRRIEVVLYNGHETSNNTQNAMDRRYWIPWPATVANQDLTLYGIRFALPLSATSDCELVPRFAEVRQIRVGQGTTIIESGPTYCFGIARNTADYDQYDGALHDQWGNEEVEMLDNELLTIDCEPTDNAVHASAIVRRKKPSPISTQIPPVPVPEQASTTAPL